MVIMRGSLPFGHQPFAKVLPLREDKGKATRKILNISGRCAGRAKDGQ
jgi:hypothetical protein